jgi:hypothetical protein
MTYRIEMEDASRYLPHDPTGREYQHYVYRGTEKNIFTGQEQPRLVFSGSRSECLAYVNAQEARRDAEMSKFNRTRR